MGLYDKKCSDNNQIIQQFCKFLGNQVPANKVIELDDITMLKVYKDIRSEELLWYEMYVSCKKNYDKVEDKKMSFKMNSRHYYIYSKFNWNQGNLQQSYKSNMSMWSPKTNILEDLQRFSKIYLSSLDMVLQLHVLNPLQS